MILRPLQLIYEWGSDLKNKLYDSNFIQKIDVGVPVISVGNISVGGTGKTPCVLLLANSYLAAGYQRIVIVSRSYKGSLKTPQKVDLMNPKATQIFGDEPCLLQSLLPQCSVCSGPVKYKTALQAVAFEKPDLVIIDDGFSHRKLARQFDLVLVDSTAPLNYFQPLPIGRLRESLRQLGRADAILLTKTNLSEDEKILKLSQIILKHAPQLKTSLYKSKLILQMGSLQAERDPLFVFCGLGRPESFKSALEKEKFQVVEFRKFPDHHHYSASEIDDIVRHYRELLVQMPGLKLVTTAKDLIKIQDPVIKEHLQGVDYRVEIDSNTRSEFFEKIGRHL